MSTFVSRSLAAVLGALLILGSANIKAHGQSATPISTVSEAEAQMLFKRMAAQSDIAFGYVQDGCYARTQLMCERMEAIGYHTGKVWSFAWGFRVDPATGKPFVDHGELLEVRGP